VLIVNQYFSKKLIGLHHFCRQLGTILAPAWLIRRELVDYPDYSLITFIDI